MGQNLLTVAEIKASSRPKLSDGNGLWLHTSKTGNKYWVFIFIRSGKRREMGLGVFGASGGQVSLALARDKAYNIRRILRAGGDPFLELPERKATADRESERALLASVRKFGDLADEYIEANKSSWRGQKTEAGWRNTLSVHAAPLRGIAIDKVKTVDVVDCLKVIWQTKPETATKLRVRLKQILDYAKALGLRTGDNPAEWEGHLEQVLKPVARSINHHAAMPYKEIPAFLPALDKSGGMGALALRFVIFTAARSGEVRGAKWSEIEGDVWTIPAARMKSGVEHSVPLSPAALDVLRLTKQMRVSDLIFPGMKFVKPLSDMTLAKALQTAGAGQYTVHGFRSAFRDWCGNETNTPREIAEAALAHSIGNKTEQAYRRGDPFKKRSELMAAWADYCGGVANG